MNWLAGTFLVGMTSFIATNIDDIVILMIFFSQVNATFRRRHVVTGQYLGFVTLLLASLPGYFGGLIMPKPWLGLLGFLPIIMGVSQLIQPSESEPTVQNISHKRYEPAKTTSMKSKLKTLLSPQTYTVAAVTIANGGDNIGIYVPLFASSSFLRLVAIIGVFFVLVGVWCWVAERLVRQAAIARGIARYGHRIAPFVLIALGLYILADSETYRLFPSERFSINTQFSFLNAGASSMKRLKLFLIVFIALVSFLLARPVWADANLTKSPDYAEVTQELSDLLSAKDNPDKSGGLTPADLQQLVGELRLQKYILETAEDGATCTNKTGKTLGIYAHKLSKPGVQNNSLLYLADGQTTDDDWDCEGIYLPAESKVIGLTPTDTQAKELAEPLALKIVDGTQLVAMANPETGEIELNVPPAKMIKTGAKNWEIPTLSQSDIDGKSANAPVD